jgi:hypothetical protein
MDEFKELKKINTHLKNLRIPEVENRTHQKALREMIVEEMKRIDEKKSLFALPLIKYALPVAAVLILVFGIWLFILRDLIKPGSTIGVVAIQGTVYERAAANEETKMLQKQGEYEQGTVLLTESVSSLTFSMGKNTIVRLKESSRLEILAIDFNDLSEKSSLLLKKGKIECSVQLPGTSSTFEVLTENTRLMVCGTKFSVEVLANGDVIVEVVEGKVKIDNYFKQENALASLKENSAETYAWLDNLLKESSIVLQQQHKLFISYNEVDERNKKFSNLVQKIKNLKAGQTEKQEFQALMQEFKEVIDPKNILERGLSESKVREDEFMQEEQGLKDTSGADREKEEVNSSQELTGGASEADVVQEDNALRLKEISSLPQGEEKETRMEIEAQILKPKESISIPFNNSVESGIWAPDGWYKSEDSPVLEWTDKVARTGKKSLKISLPEKKDNVYAWGCTINNSLPYEKILTLKVCLKTEDLRGQGACLTLRADDTKEPSGKAEMYATTQGKRIIKGSEDWTEYTLSFSAPLLKEMKSITIYLIVLPATSGGIYFDDITLSYEE